LLGQCLLEGNLRVVEAPDERFWRISSGTGETSPKALILAPLILQGKILGIVEIALLKTPDQALCDQLQELSTLFAMSLEILSRNLRMKATLSSKAESEQALSKQLNFQQSLIDTIPYPIFYKGPDTRFLGINRAYCETFGVAPEDLIGKRVLDLLYLPEADRLSYQAEDEATTANIASVKRQMNIPFADGKLHNTLYFVSGFRQADGSPGGLVGTFIDLDDLPTKNRQSVEHTA
jgi:PAS domain S-box-containing protein